MDITVREARLEDAEGIINVLNPMIETKKYSAMVRRITLERQQNYMRDFPERGIFHIAVDENETVVGLQSVEPIATYTTAFDHVGEIGTFVNLALRGQGIGKKLFAATVTKAKEKGYEKLFAYVRADNPVALKAYQAQGFTIIGIAKRQAKIDGNYIDEIFIEKFL